MATLPWDYTAKLVRGCRIHEVIQVTQLFSAPVVYFILCPKKDFGIALLALYEANLFTGTEQSRSRVSLSTSLVTNLGSARGQFSNSSFCSAITNPPELLPCCYVSAIPKK